jgi:hypothetical protein
MYWRKQLMIVARVIEEQLITGDKSGNNIYHFTDNWRNTYFISVPIMDERVILS